MSKSKNVLIMLTGSIACYKTATLISRLVQAQYDVQTVASEAALQFLGPATLEGLTGKPPLTSTFASGQAMQHIHLMRWADLIVLCPATAHTLNKLASGLADDLIGTLFLAHDFQKPFWVAPAMNGKMWHHPATQKSIQTLQDWGLDFLAPTPGALACGEVGIGRLMEPEDIFSRIQTYFQASSSSAKNILITAGGTREPIDGVRSITNSSTGATGALLADHFSRHGHKVTLLRAENAIRPIQNVTQKNFRSFAELQELLQSELSSSTYDAVLHLAAVSDYGVESVLVDGKDVRALSINDNEKIASGHKITLNLAPHPKLIDHIKSWSRNRDVKLIGFKLTHTPNKDLRHQAVTQLFAHAPADFIVHNDASEISQEQHIARLYNRAGDEILCHTKQELAEVLEKEIL